MYQPIFILELLLNDPNECSGCLAANTMPHYFPHAYAYSMPPLLYYYQLTPSIIMIGV